MNNVDFLKYINSAIVLNDNRYYVYVGAIYGYDNEHGFDNGVSFLINDDLRNDVYSIEEILKNNDYDNEYVVIIDNPVFVHEGPDIDRYVLKNNMVDYTYTEDELNAFYQTFMKMIKLLANYENDNINTNKNQIYIKVINYYYNLQTDEALKNIILILQSQNYNYTSSTSYTTCGCNTSASDSSLNENNVNCSTSYQNAMALYLIQMLGDVDFYYDFFYIDGEPIDELIDSLIKLIEEFKTLGYDISFSSNSSHCGCSQLSKDKGECNYNILDNYIRVLNWIKNCEIELNRNKIKIYGETFGELLPKMLF